nr:MAG TPA: hypothetical protein [Caudoviricetes sp.]DAQ41869.1 MAG TPA: hypothetical protein [Caudoviricetes sp.]
MSCGTSLRITISDIFNCHSGCRFVAGEKIFLTVDHFGIIPPVDIEDSKTTHHLGKEEPQ